MNKQRDSQIKMQIDMMNGFPEADVDKLDVGLLLDAPGGGRVCLRLGKTTREGIQAEEFFLPAETAIMLAEQLVIAANVLAEGGNRGN